MVVLQRGPAMRMKRFMWSAFVIALITVSQTAVLKAETMSDSLETGGVFNSVLLFCTILTGLSLLGICLATILRKR